MYWGIRRGLGVRGNRPGQIEGTPQNVGLDLIPAKYQGRNDRINKRSSIRSSVLSTF